MLNQKQKAYIDKLVEAYERKTGSVIAGIPFRGSGFELEVDPLVADPGIMNAGKEVVKYLVKHPYLVKDKIVLDMGTGCGIIGIAAALLGARKVFMTDVDPGAVKNTKRNVAKNNLQQCEVFQGDLFENYGNRPLSDVQIFNHPFFPADPIKNKDWTGIVLGGTELFRRYLREADSYSTNGAIYIFPWALLADTDNGPGNDPGKVGPEMGYEILRSSEQKPDAEEGHLKDLIKIYILKKKNN